MPLSSENKPAIYSSSGRRSHKQMWKWGGNRTLPIFRICRGPCWARPFLLNLNKGWVFGDEGQRGHFR